MARKQAPRPTDAELAILAVLWRDGPSTVRHVHQALAAESRVGYTTTLKLMQIMHAKSLVKRDKSGRSHVYAAAIARESTQRHLMRELIDRLFDGSAARLVLGALSLKAASPDELEQIRRAIGDSEEKRS